MAKAAKKSVKFKMVEDLRLARGFQRVFIFEFGALEMHRDSVDKSFQRDIKVARELWDSLADKTAEEVAEAYADDLDLVMNLLPRLQWSAQFVMVFATFEDMMIKLCRMADARLPNGKALGDIWKTGINGAKIFLSQIDGAGAIFGSKDWEFATELQKIRNAIVHNGGRIDLEQTPDLKSVLLRLKKKKLPGANLVYAYEGGEDGTEALPEIVLTSEFVKFVIEELENLVRRLANLKLPRTA